MKLLVAVDLTGATDIVVKKAEELAIALSAKVWLLHIAEPDPDFVGFKVGPKEVRNSLAHEFHQEHCQIQDFADRMRNSGLDATALLIQGATAETILKEAHKLEADMIIIGSHGHGVIYQVLIGSVSEGVIQHSEIPIFIVPVHNKKLK